MHIAVEVDDERQVWSMQWTAGGTKYRLTQWCQPVAEDCVTQAYEQLSGFCLLVCPPVAARFTSRHAHCSGSQWQWSGWSMQVHSEKDLLQMGTVVASERRRSLIWTHQQQQGPWLSACSPATSHCPLMLVHQIRDQWGVLSCQSTGAQLEGLVQSTGTLMEVRCWG